MSVTITLIKEESGAEKELTVTVDEGLRILDLKHNKECEEFLENYECACEGSLACSTCHVILDQKSYALLSSESPATDDEEDMLDLASGLTATSRLGCQIVLKPLFDGMRIKIPSKNRNSSPS